MRSVEFRLGESYYLFAESEKKDCIVDLFCPAHLQSNSLLSVIDSHGRGRALLFKHQEKKFVLRRYHRGGMARRICENHYCWQGLKKTRPWREFELLRQMTEQRLPCPRPYACLVQRQGLRYTGSLITEFIPESQTLAQVLQSRELDSKVWFEIGRTLRIFHDAGVYHADLNAHNVLLDDRDRVFLIDFDRGAIKKDRRGWKYDTLRRLQRSIKKCWMQADLFYFSPASWDDLRDGYIAPK